MGRGHSDKVGMYVLVAARRPLGFNFILSMNGVNELGGVTVRSNDCVRFGHMRSTLCSALHLGI